MSGADVALNLLGPFRYGAHGAHSAMRAIAQNWYKTAWGIKVPPGWQRLPYSARGLAILNPHHNAQRQEPPQLDLDGENILGRGPGIISVQFGAGFASVIPDVEANAPDDTLPVVSIGILPDESATVSMSRAAADLQLLSLRGYGSVGPARHFGRTVEMWRRFETIMDAGFATMLVEICPRLIEEIQAHGVEEMENARASGCGEDIKYVKDLMQSLRSFHGHPAMKANDKDSRGFNHPQIGRHFLSTPSRPRLVLSSGRRITSEDAGVTGVFFYIQRWRVHGHGRLDFIGQQHTDLVHKTSQRRHFAIPEI
ncbi:hypothetical protein JB92DRAFT_2833766 [Gautieria morchelliformis]|nr:hypothetical protein JB92DRAFT_2833766 [Gautieria morchelliformis]